MSNINDIVQVRTCCVRAAQISLNVLHYQCTAKAGTGCTPAQMALTFDAGCAAAYKAWLDNNSTYRGVGVKTLFPTPSIEVASVANTGVGTGGAIAVPGQVSGIINLTTAVPGRKGRGRIYPGFFSTTLLTAAGELGAAGQLLLAAINTAIPFTFTSGAGGNTNQYQLIIYNRLAHVGTNVITSLAESKLATQRRRGDFGRTNVVPF